MKKQILLLFLAMLLMSCSSSSSSSPSSTKPEDRIIGKWQNKDTPGASLQFFPDGTLNIQGPYSEGRSDSGIGTYKVLDETHVKIDWPDSVTSRGPITEIRKMTLTKDDLDTFDNNSGNAMARYRRVQ